MANQEDEELDIAAQMGFSSFGGKKRKREEAALTAKPPAATVVVPDTKLRQQQDQASQASAANTTTEPDLRALRNGVRNERGDMAYFMPSFIEDPWKHLRKT